MAGENIPAVPVPVGNSNPVGDGSAAKEPSISIDDLVGKVAEQLLPKLSQEITGASKRHAASLREELAGLLKGNAPASNEGDDGKKPANPAKYEAEKAKTEAEALRKQVQSLTSRLNAEAVGKALAQDFGGRTFAEGPKALLAQAILANVREADGVLYVHEGDTDVPLSEFVAKKATDPTLLKPSGHPGSGAVAAAAVPAAMKADVSQFKTKQEVTHIKQADGQWTPRRVRKSDPDPVEKFIAAFPNSEEGLAAWRALPLK
jgi:hypothetical protein